MQILGISKHMQQGERQEDGQRFLHVRKSTLCALTNVRELRLLIARTERSQQPFPGPGTAAQIANG